MDTGTMNEDLFRRMVKAGAVKWLTGAIYQDKHGYYITIELAICGTVHAPSFNDKRRDLVFAKVLTYIRDELDAARKHSARLLAEFDQVVGAAYLEKVKAG